jgi:hypothetical protein
VKRSLFVLILAIALVVAVPAVASAKTPTLKQLAKTVTKLQKKVNAQARTIAGQGAQIATLTGKLSADEAAITTLTTKLSFDETTITSQGATIASQATTLADAAPLLAIAPYVSLRTGAMNGVVGPSIVFQGANVHVRSTSAENDNSGLGNLIVGWDDPPLSPPAPFRSGSNNLIAGDYNNFTSFGGFVTGFHNKVSAIYASVSGGEYNTSSYDYASVSGYVNTANRASASVSGGTFNTASGDGASVSGGSGNTASGNISSVSGGDSITLPTTGGWQAGTVHSP